MILEQLVVEAVLNIIVTEDTLCYLSVIPFCREETIGIYVIQTYHIIFKIHLYYSSAECIRTGKKFGETLPKAVVFKDFAYRIVVLFVINGYIALF